MTNIFKPSKVLIYYLFIQLLSKHFTVHTSSSAYQLIIAYLFSNHFYSETMVLAYDHIKLNICKDCCLHLRNSFFSEQTLYMPVKEHFLLIVFFSIPGLMDSFNAHIEETGYGVMTVAPIPEQYKCPFCIKLMRNANTDLSW